MAGVRLVDKGLKHTKKGISESVCKTAKALAELLHASLPFVLGLFGLLGWLFGLSLLVRLFFGLSVKIVKAVKAFVKAFHGDNEEEYHSHEETPSSETEDINPNQNFQDLQSSDAKKLHLLLDTMKTGEVYNSIMKVIACLRWVKANAPEHKST